MHTHHHLDMSLPSISNHHTHTTTLVPTYPGVSLLTAEKEAEIRRLELIFKKADTDNSHRLDRTEIKAMLHGLGMHADVDAMIARADKSYDAPGNTDGQLNFAEFYQAIKNEELPRAYGSGCGLECWRACVYVYKTTPSVVVTTGHHHHHHEYETPAEVTQLYEIMSQMESHGGSGHEKKHQLQHLITELIADFDRNEHLSRDATMNVCRIFISEFNTTIESIKDIRGHLCTLESQRCSLQDRYDLIFEEIRRCIQCLEEDRSAHKCYMGE